MNAKSVHHNWLLIQYYHGHRAFHLHYLLGFLLGFHTRRRRPPPPRPPPHHHHHHHHHEWNLPVSGHGNNVNILGCFGYVRVGVVPITMNLHDTTHECHQGRAESSNAQLNELKDPEYVSCFPKKSTMVNGFQKVHG